METSNLLPDGSGCWQDIKLMRSNGGMDSPHVRMCPCEDVMVLFENFLHALSFFLCHEGTDVREVSVLHRNLDCL